MRWIAFLLPPAVLLLAAASALALLLVSCDNGGKSSVDMYFEEVAPILDPVTDATNNWTRLAEEQAEADLTSITSEQALDMAQRLLDAATQGYVASRDGLTEFRLIVPPKECDEVHQVMTEALSASERGFLETKTYLESGIRTGRPDEDQRERANRLFADADREKERGLVLIARSDCG